MFSPSIDELLLNNRAHAEQHGRVHLDVSPSRKLAVVTCMDSRMDVFEILGLRNGEAHVIRNAGGVITDDVIRSLCLSQRVLGTAEIVLMHHT
ncbi:MAG: carbonic anhydrase, partial [Acidimicrobiia bacterium]|nr:carbonic anhydrase [Acidimicrobiia bacterium]